MAIIKTTDLFGNVTEIDTSNKTMPGRNKSGGYIDNPMIQFYAKTDGEKCKDCVFLVRKLYAKVYYKCELRGNVETRSTKSDHRANWDACGKFKKDN